MIEQSHETRILSLGLKVPLMHHKSENFKQICFPGNFVKRFCVLGLSATLLACGGGGGSSKSTTSSPTTFTGTVASGLALSGAAVSANCASGSNAGSATTNTSGVYSMTLASTVALPCILKATLNGASYYSAIYSGQSVANITPITQLIVANALGADPANAYNGTVSSVSSKLSSSNIANATSIIESALTTIGITFQSGQNPLTSTFQAATSTAPGDLLDSTLDTLTTALNKALVPYGTLLSNLQTFTTATAAANYVRTANITTANLPAQMTLYTTSYDLSTLPLLGVITYHDANAITYASLSTPSLMIILGKFTYPSGTSTNASEELANISGVTGKIYAVIQYSSSSSSPTPVMAVTQISIDAASFNTYVLADDLPATWQLISATPGIEVTNTGVQITCLITSPATTQTFTVTSATQTIESQGCIE